jgi:hypothetical protein
MSTADSTVSKEELKEEMRDTERNALELAMNINKMESIAADRVLKMRIVGAIENIWMANIEAVRDVTDKLKDKDDSLLKDALGVLAKTANSASNLDKMLAGVSSEPAGAPRHPLANGEGSGSRSHVQSGHRVVERTK